MNDPFRKSAVVGGFAPLDAVVDVATSAVDRTVDVATSVIDRIPGSEYVKDAVNVVTGPVGDFVKGPLRDFSNTAVGTVIMRSISVAVSMSVVMLSPAIGPYVFAWVGPTLAFAAWSIPGLAKGEPFDEALIKEFAYRVAYVIGIFSKEAGDAVAKALGPVMSQQLQLALAKGKEIAEKYYGASTQEALRQLGVAPEQVLENMGLTPEQLAARLNIREDVAAMAISWLKRDPNYIEKVKKWYDPKTGKNTEDAFYERLKREADQKVALAKAAFMARVLAMPNPCDAYVESVRFGDRAAAAVFKKQCEHRKLQDAALHGLAAKNPCGAYVEAVRLQRSIAAAALKKRCADFNNVMTSFAVPQERTASAKATSYALIAAAGVVLVAGGAAWYLRKRGK